MVLLRLRLWMLLVLWLLTVVSIVAALLSVLRMELLVLRMLIRVVLMVLCLWLLVLAVLLCISVLRGIAVLSWMSMVSTPSLSVWVLTVLLRHYLLCHGLLLLTRCSRDIVRLSACPRGCAPAGGTGRRSVDIAHIPLCI